MQSWPFKVRDRARAPAHSPCFVEVRNKHEPSKIFTLLRAPGNRTVCKKGRTILFLISQSRAQRETRCATDAHLLISLRPGL